MVAAATAKAALLLSAALPGWPPRCHDDEKAMIGLRRPGSPEISEADAHIFRQVRQAAARRETAPWAFHVAGPPGTREVTEHEARQDPARTPDGIPGQPKGSRRTAAVLGGT